jgi:hypothetical protein
LDRRPSGFQTPSLLRTEFTSVLFIFLNETKKEGIFCQWQTGNAVLVNNKLDLIMEGALDLLVTIYPLGKTFS